MFFLKVPYIFSMFLIIFPILGNTSYGMAESNMLGTNNSANGDENDMSDG